MNRRVLVGLAVLGLLVVAAGTMSAPADLRASLFGGSRERALALIARRGGQVRVDERQPGKPVVKVDLYAATEFTDEDLKAIETFPRLRSLDLMGTRVTDAGVSRLVSHLGALQTLDLMGTKVTDAVLEPIGRLKTLRGLGLHGTFVTNAGMERVGMMETLERVNLGDTGVTDDGLRRLRGLTRLRVLGLEATGISDEGLRSLRAMTSLRDINLGTTPITDEGLKQLTGFTELRKLKLLGCPITDAGLTSLANLHELESLNLDFTRIRTLSALKDLNKLRELRLRDAPVPAAEVEALRRALGHEFEVYR
ncbi:MAG: hypothetical protein P4L84_19715 [Isosphaeraceae bacterium]|nr:hypothetical protein [Isosphaeraceae bacterium]